MRLEAVLGSEEAVTLMSSLPPSGWDALATKETRAMVFALVASNATVAAIAFGTLLVR